MKRPDKLSLLAALFALVACCAFASDPVKNTPASPGPENQKLVVWYGEWTYTGETFTTPVGPAGKFTGRMTGRPVQNGFAGEFVYDEKSPSGETRYLEFDFWDPVSKDHAYIFLGDDGYVERGTFAMKGNVTTFANTIMVEGRLHQIRGVETVAADGLGFTKKIEVLIDGKNWVSLSEAKFTKVAAPAVEQELVKLEQDWSKAYVARDLKTLGRIEADDWSYTDDEGTVFSRAQDIADVETGAFVATDFKVENLKVRLYGDTAVVTGRQMVKATYKGKDISGVLQITDMWLRRAGSWQCIASHLSRKATP